MLIDTHAHLFDERFAADLPAVLERATKSGVERIVCVGIDLDSSHEAVRLAKQYPILVAAVGIQPNHVAEAKPGDWGEIVRLAETEPSVHAIGETGLDRYWDRTPFSQQEDYFARHMALSRRLGKALIIHNRDADADTVRMLRDEFDRHGPVRAVMHSFSGSRETAEACLEMGLHISFAGMLTYKTAADLRAVAAHVPLDRLLVETDCPYLAPVPHRGKRNEPAFVAHTAAVLAEAKGMSAEEIAEHTTRNARSLFGLRA